MLAIATSREELATLSAVLHQFGAEIVDIAAPGGDRLVALAAVVDEWSTESSAARLRAAGYMAVTRPDRGAGLIAWERNTVPVTFGDRLSVCLAWSEHDRAGLANLIELGPGGFGSGHHPTTRMIIEDLIERIMGGERVLDVGCGSGVLSLAAARLGAASCIGVDRKPEAVEATDRNASLNGMSDRVHATGADMGAIPGPFDLVLANIARAGIVALADELAAQVADGGHLVLSGITPRQCDQVAEFLGPLVETDRKIEGDWAVIVLGRVTAGQP